VIRMSDAWPFFSFVEIYFILILNNTILINLIPKFCTKYRSGAQKALCLKRRWSDFDPQAYTLYGEDQNHEASFKGKALQAVGDSWCKIQVTIYLLNLSIIKRRKKWKKNGHTKIMRLKKD
jgi:hypothetical protein